MCVCTYIYKLNGGSKPINITVGPPAPETGAASPQRCATVDFGGYYRHIFSFSLDLSHFLVPSGLPEAGCDGNLRGFLAMEAMALIEIDGLPVNSMVIFHGKLLVIYLMGI